MVNPEIIMTERKEINIRKMIEAFTKKTAAKPEEAWEYLKDNNYNFSKAIKYYENDTYTRTELILQKEKNKERALDEIEWAIVESQSLHKDYFWVSLENMTKLNEVQHLIVRLMNWINWESWEGDLTLYDDIADELKQLNVAWLYELYDECLKRKKEIKNTEIKIWEDGIYEKLCDTFLSRRDELIEVLYSYAVEHIDELP